MWTSNIQLFLQQIRFGWFIIDQMQQASNIFIATISCLRSNTKVADLLHHFKDQLRSIKMRNARLEPQAILKKYNTLVAKYHRGTLLPRPRGWHENQRKLFLWFLFCFYHLNFKKYSEITSKQWRQFSECFWGKDVLLLRYEAVALQRSSQRVYWSASEQDLLKELIKSSVNGKWGDIARELFFASEGQHYKTSKQCRQHWFNHLSTDIRKGNWTIEEDLAILAFVRTYGRHWSRLIEQIGRVRTEHMAKNRYGSLIHFGRKYCNAASEVNSNDETVLIASLIDYLSTHRALLYDSNPPSSPEMLCKSDKSISIQCQEIKEELPQHNQEKIPTGSRLTQKSIEEVGGSNGGAVEGAANQENYNAKRQSNNSKLQSANQDEANVGQQCYHQNNQFQYRSQHYLPEHNHILKQHQQHQATQQAQILHQNEALLPNSEPQVGSINPSMLYTVGNHFGYAFNTMQYHPPTILQPIGIINIVIPFPPADQQQQEQQQQEQR